MKFYLHFALALNFTFMYLCVCLVELSDSSDDSNVIIVSESAESEDELECLMSQQSYEHVTDQYAAAVAAVFLNTTCKSSQISCDEQHSSVHKPATDVMHREHSSQCSNVNADVAEVVSDDLTVVPSSVLLSTEHVTGAEPQNDVELELVGVQPVQSAQRDEQLMSSVSEASEEVKLDEYIASELDSTSYNELSELLSPDQCASLNDLCNGSFLGDLSFISECLVEECASPQFLQHATGADDVLRDIHNIRVDNESSDIHHIHVNNESRDIHNIHVDNIDNIHVDNESSDIHDIHVDNIDNIHVDNESSDIHDIHVDNESSDIHNIHVDNESSDIHNIHVDNENSDIHDIHVDNIDNIHVDNIHNIHVDNESSHLNVSNREVISNDDITSCVSVAVDRSADLVQVAATVAAAAAAAAATAAAAAAADDDDDVDDGGGDNDNLNAEVQQSVASVQQSALFYSQTNDNISNVNSEHTYKPDNDVVSTLHQTTFSVSASVSISSVQSFNALMTDRQQAVISQCQSSLLNSEDQNKPISVQLDMNANELVTQTCTNTVDNDKLLVSGSDMEVAIESVQNTCNDVLAMDIDNTQHLLTAGTRKRSQPDEFSYALCKRFRADSDLLSAEWLRMLDNSDTDTVCQSQNESISGSDQDINMSDVCCCSCHLPCDTSSVSYCTAGHACCQTCLQRQVKRLLSSPSKVSLLCLSVSDCMSVCLSV